MIAHFNHTINIWIKALERYDFIQLCAKPSPNSWSIGQVYVHLIEEGKYYLEQIKICTATNDNAGEEASPDARTMFLNNDFQDEMIEGPPENASIPQPGNKALLMKDLLALKAVFNDMALLNSKCPCKGKTKHPGLNYFNAAEWFQFAEMHFRHHLRQKERIDSFLKTYNDHRA